MILLSIDPMEAIYTSQNGISMMMLLAVIPFYLVTYRLNEKIDLKPAVITFFISIWGVGRSGILASFILLFCLFLIKYESKYFRGIIFIFMVTIITILLYPYFDSQVQYNIFDGTFNNSFFNNAILNYAKTFDSTYSERDEIINYYFQNLDLIKLIFGVNPKTEYWPNGEILAYNYHNSFIALHSQTGLFGLLTIFVLVVSLFIFLSKDKIYSLLILTLLVRWSTDSYLFFEFFDFIPLFFIFMLINKFTKSKRNIMSQSCKKNDPIVRNEVVKT
jgi:hypothetical protein